jgi:hypothetical protein
MCSAQSRAKTVAEPVFQGVCVIKRAEDTFAVPSFATFVGDVGSAWKIRSSNTSKSATGRCKTKE